VDMTCEGCVGAVKRILGKMEGAHTHGPLTLSHVLDALRTAFTLAPSLGPDRAHARRCAPAACAGVTSYDVDLASKKVVVRGDVTPEAVLERVSKMGKDTQLWTE
jgi:copper chaperone CopZ